MSKMVVSWLYSILSSGMLLFQLLFFIFLFSNFVYIFPILFLVSEVEEEDVLQTFFKDRALNGDFISKASDMLWRREVVSSVEGDASEIADTLQQAEEVRQVVLTIYSRNSQ